jgi:hypothetical protein
MPTEQKESSVTSPGATRIRSRVWRAHQHRDQLIPDSALKIPKSKETDGTNLSFRQSTSIMNGIDDFTVG